MYVCTRLFTFENNEKQFSIINKLSVFLRNDNPFLLNPIVISPLLDIGVPKIQLSLGAIYNFIGVFRNVKLP